jgi:mannose-1-phosphate guanylyltransferase
MTNHPRMKAIIFAGGIGTRMWPLSRKNSPKQFEPIIEGKSTLQLTVERIRPEFHWKDIYISTGAQYRNLIVNQLPEIPQSNIIVEPEMRDVAPAVGYLMTILSKNDPDTPVAILWSDHLVQRVDVFKRALFTGAELLYKDSERYIFIGQRPRFPNQNLGWIEFGDVVDRINDFDVRQYKSWHYRPSLENAKEYFLSGHHAWNPGYFVVTPKFVLAQFKRHAPDISLKLEQISRAVGTDKEAEVIGRIYPQFEKISFDDAVVTKAAPDEAVVISVELGWADIGTWEALKEALQTNPQDNLIHGQVSSLDTTNSVIYSYTNQMVSVIDLHDMVVVVTKDVVMVTPQRAIPKIKTLLANFEGSVNENYT